MPRYFFNLTDGDDVMEEQNPQGVELPGDAAAREDGLMLARDLKHGKLLKDRNWEGWFVSIVDESGQEIETIPIADAPEAS